ncbi:CoA ester lyase [Thioflexithrix psekupsensis]|uniref:CoA ester lyase n=2 Tax=Thioflexithrix psekupsensis TaxID=1570016 RepID=A0A251X6I0_9GAMM|nr:CoA ester lyase [Thioflexithrix psekupsensis]
MEKSLRPRRSVLYMPGANAKALDKARSLAADALILDLEDAVAPDAKLMARQQVAQAVNAGGYAPREVIVRVNGLNTEWGKADLEAVAPLPIDGVLLPKIEHPQQLHDALSILDAVNPDHHLPLWIMAETPKGMLNIAQIVQNQPRLSVIVMGTSDLAKDLRVRHTPDRVGLLVPLSLCVIAARAYGLDIIDGVYLDLNDEIGYNAACQQGRDMGFDGKTLIHPKQIEAANQAFAPSAQEVEQAHAVITAWEQAKNEGKGVVVVNGRLVEYLHVIEAQRILALAQAITSLGA